MIKQKSKEHSLDIILSNVLRIGLALAFLTTLCGGAIVFWQNGSDVINYERFTGELDYLKNVSAIVASAMKSDGLAVIQLGTLLMIATPVSRILMCVVLFLWEKDYLYTAFSGFVLAILIYSFFFRSLN